jgi:RNA polymerase sigma factor (sigma-70 family)
MATVEQRLRPVERVGDPPTEEARTRLECLYRAHGERVYAICAAMLRDPQEAEDAAQQVFVSAFRALRRGSEPRDPGAWLATIARNESWARGRRQPTVPLQPELRDVAQEDPSTVVVRQSELASIWQAIQDLPASQRDALLLREVRGLSYHELVSDLQLSQASVRSLLNRARQTLRGQLRRGAAALTGTPWLNLLTRLFGDGSSPALSSASRTAVVGLGALAITGGASVVPSLHVPHRLPAHADAHRAVAATRPARSADSAAAAAPVGEAVGERSLLQLRDDRRSRGRSSSAGEDSGSGGVRPGGSGEHQSGRAGASSGGGVGHDGSSGGGTGSDLGGAPSVSSDGGPGSDRFSAAPRSGGETTATSGSPGDGSTSGGDGGRMTSTSGGGSPDGSGGSGSTDGSGTSSSLSMSARDGGGSDSPSVDGGSSGSSGSDGGSGNSGSGA